MLSKAIGIISYLPDDVTIRSKRIDKLNSLLIRCNIIFPNIQIVIIAQNWKDYYPYNYPNLWVVNFDKPLGITGARKALRRVFLDYCNKDYLIMLDDDCELKGTSGVKYLEQIDNNPDCFIEFNKTLLKLFAISKTILSQVDYDEVNPEDGDGFEDRVFVNKIRKKFPDKQREFKNTGISEYSISTRDELSTWYKNQDIKKMLEKTNTLINEL